MLRNSHTILLTETKVFKVYVHKSIFMYTSVIFFIRMNLLSFTHVSACACCSFTLMAQECCTVKIHPNSSVPLQKKIWDLSSLQWFLLLTWKHVSRVHVKKWNFRIRAFIPFNITKSHQNLFQNSYSKLYPHKKWMKVSFALLYPLNLHKGPVFKSVWWLRNSV